MEMEGHGHLRTVNLVSLLRVKAAFEEKGVPQERFKLVLKKSEHDALLEEFSKTGLGPLLCEYKKIVGFRYEVSPDICEHEWQRVKDDGDVECIDCGMIMEDHHC